MTSLERYYLDRITALECYVLDLEKKISKLKEQYSNTTDCYNRIKKEKSKKNTI